MSALFLRSLARSSGGGPLTAGGGGEGLQEYDPAPSAYFNSREPHTGAADQAVYGTLFAEDFGRRGGSSPALDGGWVTLDCDNATTGSPTWASEKGWCGQINNPWTNRGVILGETPFGTYCAVNSFDEVKNGDFLTGGYAATDLCDSVPGSGDGSEHGCVETPAGVGTTSINGADHALLNETSHIYVRWYEKVASDFVWSNLKGITINQGPAGVGGIRFFNFGHRIAASLSTSDPGFAFVDRRNDEKLDCDNLSEYSSVMGGNKGSWHCLQIELKMNSAPTVQDGHFRFWADNCGTDGIPAQGVAGAPTLRGQYTDIDWLFGGDTSDLFGDVWFEDWSNDCYCSKGKRFWDMIWCADGEVRGDNNPLPFCAPFTL